MAATSNGCDLLGCFRALLAHWCIPAAVLVTLFRASITYRLANDNARLDA